MFLLAYDTSGREGSVALAYCQDEGCEIVGQSAISGGTFSAQLIPETALLLEKHKLDITQVAGLAVATGPGSFTGLRAGLAAVKGLAEALHLPIAGISVLQAMAWDRGGDLLVAALDASRGAAYVGEYASDGRKRIMEALLPIEQLAGRLTGQPQATLVACDGEILQRLPTAQKIDRPNAAEYARIGWSKLRNHETIPVDELDANYIRRSDAEIFARQ